MTSLLHDLALFRDRRGWGCHHTPRNLAEALSVEAGELLQCYLWDGALPARGCPRQELADVLIYALNLCNVLELDPETIVREKMQINAAKYPSLDSPSYRSVASQIPASPLEEQP